MSRIRIIRKMQKRHGQFAYRKFCGPPLTAKEMARWLLGTRILREWESTNKQNGYLRHLEDLFRKHENDERRKEADATDA